MITSSILGQDDRLRFFPSITKQYIFFEQAVYHFFEKMCEDYDGAYWEFVELDNGGKFLYPRGKDIWHLVNSTTQESHDLSAEAAGICVTLITLSYYAMNAWEQEDQIELNKLAILEQQLYQYAMQLSEADNIRNIIN
uniref:Antirestriction protein n=1 Tax=Vibrio sp. 23023 TaxID=452803 RepID=A9M4P6_9VIBR|nr:antirestriction protein [Vibrio sp. 23023]ABX77014.1 Hypothetical protein BMSA_0028 [Vibrio sp. 23023]